MKNVKKAQKKRHLKLKRIIREKAWSTKAPKPMDLIHLEENEKQAKTELKEAKKEYRTNVKKKKKAKKKGIPTAIIAVVFLCIGTLILGAVMWMMRTWPRLKMDELMYQLSAPITGTGSDIMKQFVLQAVVPTAAVGCVAVFIVVRCTKKGIKPRKICKVSITTIAAACIAVSSVLLWNHLDLGAYLENQSQDSGFIKAEYVSPDEVSIDFPETKRNLIYIYLESMEITYADEDNGGAFTENVIPELTSLAESNECFSDSSSALNGAYSLPGTTWTMGGIFGATSGLPLQVNAETDDLNGLLSSQDSLFPGITTLGDVLEDEGYTQEFLCGSDASFGGRELYFQSHGNYAIHDYDYAVENGWIPEGYHVWWGYEDSIMLDHAKDDLTSLAASGQPFNMTMLTADTHFEDGYVCSECQDQYDTQYSNVMACSSRQVTELVSWIQQQSWYDNTTIIISGDHPTMDSDYCNEVDDSYGRRVYTTYINAPVEKQIASSRTYSTFDNFPTTLAALGVQIEGDRLGLGTNLFSSENTLTEIYGLDTETAELNKKSTFMDDISDVQALSAATPSTESYNADTGQAVLSFSAVSTETEGNIKSLSVSVTQSDGSTKEYQAAYRKSFDNYVVTIDVPDNNPSAVTFTVTAHVSAEGTDEIASEDVCTFEGDITQLETAG
jgi:phosphoglycerol transferase